MNRITKKSWRFFDIPLLAAIVCIYIIGLLTLINATGGVTVGDGESWVSVLSRISTSSVTKHLLFFGTGLVVAGVVMVIDYEALGQAATLIYWLNIGLLVLVLVAGDTIFGATGWFTIGEFNFQPSELAKIALVLSLAKRLSRMPNGVQTVRELIIILLYVGLPFGIILAQNDLGTGIVYLFITIIMLFVAGCNWKLMLGLGVGGAAMLYPAWLLLGDVQRNRILVFLDPSLDPGNAGMSVELAKTAIARGGMAGMGFFNPSSQTQLDYIHVKTKDFIFAVAGETFGFFITALLILLYGFLLLRLIQLSQRAFNRFGSLLIIGVMALMAFHIFENIGMNLGVMPVTGIPLPFFSYGGSNMWTNMIALGLVYSVIMRYDRGMFKDPEVL